MSVQHPHFPISHSAIPYTPVDNAATTPASAIPASTMSSMSVSRPVGWHAKELRLDWHKRKDHYTYLAKTGLPEVHAAVINDDWEAASCMLTPEDIGLIWLPPASQRPPSVSSGHDNTAEWACQLMSNDPHKQRNAIIKMAEDSTRRTTLPGTGSLYGANLITLCIGKRAPKEFLLRLITLAKESAPQFLSSPDASGRTPLHMAIELGDAQTVRMLLDADANPLIRSNFIQHDGTKGGPSAYQVALTHGTDEIFQAILKRCIEKNHPYVIKEQKELLKNKTIDSEEKFKFLLTTTWPTLNIAEKYEILMNLARQNNNHFMIFFNKMDFVISDNFLYAICKIAASKGDSELFDFAADRSKSLKIATQSNLWFEDDIPDFLVYALRSGSQKWVTKILESRESFEYFINCSGDELIPAFADFDPDGFSARFDGIDLEPAYLDHLERTGFRKILSNAGQAVFRNFIDSRRKKQ